MSGERNIKLPSVLPRVVTALQFGISLALLAVLIIVGFSMLFNDKTLLQPRYLGLIFTLGVLTVSPIFYVSNKRIGIDEIKKGLYDAVEVSIEDVNASGMLVNDGEKKIAISNPLLFNVSYDVIKTKGSKVLYIKTKSGKDFITSI